MLVIRASARDRWLSVEISVIAHSCSRSGGSNARLWFDASLARLQHAMPGFTDYRVVAVEMPAMDGPASLARSASMKQRYAAAGQCVGPLPCPSCPCCSCISENWPSPPLLQLTLQACGLTTCMPSQCTCCALSRATRLLHQPSSQLTGSACTCHLTRAVPLTYPVRRRMLSFTYYLGMMTNGAYVEQEEGGRWACPGAVRRVLQAPAAGQAAAHPRQDEEAPAPGRLRGPAGQPPCLVLS